MRVAAIVGRPVTVRESNTPLAGTPQGCDVVLSCSVNSWYDTLDPAAICCGTVPQVPLQFLEKCIFHRIRPYEK